MHIVLFTHPDFLHHQSMPRFARMLFDGMTARGHQVEIWSPKPFFYKENAHPFLKKWFGYIDQYILFPFVVRRKVRSCKKNTLFVFTDQALGPWVPIVKEKANIVHCHDFLALRSALGEIPENKTSKSGQIYQKYIQRGFSEGGNFISVSNKTQQDLHRFLLNKNENQLSEVVYNGLNQDFISIDADTARRKLAGLINVDLQNGYLLHVGGNQWYKNRIGVIEMYDQWRVQYGIYLPLLMIGYAPTDDLIKAKNESVFNNDIYFLTQLKDEYVQQAYAGATVFLFPSLAEGFGWPIAEAMASGCMVITTKEAPMTEVAGNAGFLISRRPYNNDGVIEWAKQAAVCIQKIIDLTPAQYQIEQAKGLENAKRFNTEQALNKIEELYLGVLYNFEHKEKIKYGA